MSKMIGKVLDKAKVDSFQFVSKHYFDAKFVEVAVDYVSGAKIIGEITEKESVNPYFEKPSDIRYITDEDEGVRSRSLYVSKVDILALIKNGERLEAVFPPLPGANVYEAEEFNIKLALNLPEAGLDIGFLKGYPRLSFKISQKQLVRTHVSILGQTGSGKSYLGAKIAVELFKLKSSSNRPFEIATPIIFDSSGEYCRADDSNSQGQLERIMKVISGKEHYFPLLNEKYLSLFYDIFEIDERLESELRKWFTPTSDKDLPSQKKENQQLEFLEQPKASQLIHKFSQLRFNSTTQLANALEEYLKKYNQLRQVDNIPIPYKATSKMRRLNLNIRKTIDTSIVELLSKGLIIDLSEYESNEERQIAMLIFLRQLYGLAKDKKKSERLLLFIDEAHNYVPSVYKSYCKDEILKIAREGRKYGIALVLISQRPRWVDPTALSQCGNIFIFRTQNSDDKKHIFDSASLPDTVRDINIAKFKTGEMIAAGDVADRTVGCVVSKIDENFILSKSRKTSDKYFKEVKEIFK